MSENSSSDQPVRSAPKLNADSGAALRSRAVSGGVKVGIVGLGRMGKCHAENLVRATVGAELVAAATPVESEVQYARDVLGLDRVVSSLDELLEIDEIEAVVLVTPTSMHADQAIAVLETGRHMFVEKPLALNIEDCLRVEKAYEVSRQKNPGQVAMVGFKRRFDPSYVAAKEAVDAGEIGDVFFVRSQTCDRYDPNGFFVEFSPSSGGLIMDCNVHDIDLVRWFMSDTGGSIEALDYYAVGSCNIHPDLAQYGDVDNVVSTIHFTGGRFAQLYASRTLAHGHETTTEVIGSKGSLTIGLGAQRDLVIKRSPIGVSHRCVDDFSQRFDAAFAQEIQAFIDCCNGLIEAPITLHDATEATRIALALTESLKQNSKRIE